MLSSLLLIRALNPPGEVRGEQQSSGGQRHLYVRNLGALQHQCQGSQPKPNERESPRWVQASIFILMCFFAEAEPNTVNCTNLTFRA